MIQDEIEWVLMTVHFGLTIHNSQTGIWLAGSVPPAPSDILLSVETQDAQVSTLLSLCLGISFGRSCVLVEGRSVLVNCINCPGCMMTLKASCFMADS